MMTKAATTSPTRTFPPALLVTGCPRSGTTFMGGMLKHCPKTQEIFEPFNPAAGVEGWDRPFPYLRADDPEAERFQKIMLSLVNGFPRYHRFQEYEIRTQYPWMWKVLRRTTGSMMATRNYVARLRGIPRDGRWLIKDPHLFLGAGYLHEQMGIDVVAMVRLPAAIASSWKRLQWKPDLSIFANQPYLREDILSDYKVFSNDGLSFAEAMAWYWVYCYKTMFHFRDRNPEMLFIKQEDMGAEPIATIQAVLQRFQLPFTEPMRNRIIDYTTSKTAIPDSSHPHKEFKRDSKKISKSWQKHLSSEEIVTIRNITEHLAHEYYTDNDWSS